MTTASSPAPEGEPSLPDDVWEQFAGDSERAIRGSAPKEPSARARIVARRLREEDERAARPQRRLRSGRVRRRGRGSAPTAARRPRPARGMVVRRALGGPWARMLFTLLGIVAVVLLVSVALNPSHTWPGLLTGP